MKTLKLSLNKETLRQLSDGDMENVEGGNNGNIIRPSFLCTKAIISCVYICQTQFRCTF